MRLRALEESIDGYSGKLAFTAQRNGAKRRGIQFLLTWEQWRAWWLTDGRWANRGCHTGGLVMGRKGDYGPYAIDNVYCCTNGENAAYANKNRKKQIQLPLELAAVAVEQEAA